jgi:hypothetical protein
MAFNDRLPDFDRIITAFGSYALTTGESSIPQLRLSAIIKQVDAFFGFCPAQLDGALQRPMHAVAGLNVARIVTGATSAPNATEARTSVRRAALEEGSVAALRSLYAYRTLDVPDPSPYLRAARHGSQIGELLPQIETLDDAMRSVAAIPGNDSIFEDPTRIAMPEETVRFATGSSRDKALLLHVLLERILTIEEPAGTSLETLFSETGSFVRCAHFCINVSDMAYVAQPEGEIRYRIADSVQNACLAGDATKP